MSRHTGSHTIMPAVGYGIICGLTFPLMIASTFLQEMSLAHGAGNSFGALFFISYGATMIITSLRNLIVKNLTKPVNMPTAFIAVFLGNTLMLLLNFNVFESSWLYAILAAGSIGYGLATAEIGWLNHIAQSKDIRRLRIGIACAFLVGATCAILIFSLSNYLELCFALAIIVVSGVLFYRLKAPAARSDSPPQIKSNAAHVWKAISYLAVVSFVFGAISQVASTAESDVIPIGAQAILGIILASLLIFVARYKGEVADVSRMYGQLFPIVAVALITLPFTESRWLHLIATLFIFVAYYLSSINVRIIFCNISSSLNISLWVFLSASLGISCLLILAGVLFGSTILVHDNPATGLAMVSIVSLFVLALNPLITSKLEKRSGEKMSHAETRTDSLQNTKTIEAYGERNSLTPREIDVLTLICLGRTRSYIADELGLSPNTIKGYIHNIYQKCEAKDKQDLLDRIEIFHSKV